MTIQDSKNHSYSLNSETKVGKHLSYIQRAWSLIQLNNPKFHFTGGKDHKLLKTMFLRYFNSDVVGFLAFIKADMLSKTPSMSMGVLEFRACREWRLKQAKQMDDERVKENFTGRTHDQSGFLSLGTILNEAQKREQNE